MPDGNHHQPRKRQNKYACRLREEEKLRTADGLFFAEGPKLCLELARGCTLQTLYATEKALAHTPELEAFAGKTVLVTEPVAPKAFRNQNQPGCVRRV